MRGIAYTYKGPAHLSIGQEGAAVGAALALKPEDHIFGSHRSHGEFIAKGLSAIAKLDAADAARIMEAHQRRRAAAHGRAPYRRRAREGARRELPAVRPARRNLHARQRLQRRHGRLACTPSSRPSAPIPTTPSSAARPASRPARRCARSSAASGGIAVANSGDGSTGCGPVWEAMNFAAMAQYDTLWDRCAQGRPAGAVLLQQQFLRHGRPDRSARRWAGTGCRASAPAINPEAMHAETVDGSNPLAVADAVARKRALLLAGEGPALLDVECYRSAGHSTTDANVYRSQARRLQPGAAIDPIALFAAKLVPSGVDDRGRRSRRCEAGVARARSATVTAAAVDPATAPIVDVRADPKLIGKLMFSNAEIELPDTVAPTARPAENPRASPGRQEEPLRPRRHGRKAVRRCGRSPCATPSSRRSLHHIAARRAADRLWRGMPRMGRRVRRLSRPDRTSCRITACSIRRFPKPRSSRTAVGYALEGGRALVELMYADFIGRAGDEIFNQMAKWQSMSAGQLKMPVVLRCSVGSKYGAQHSQDWTRAGRPYSGPQGRLSGDAL